MRRLSCSAMLAAAVLWPSAPLLAQSVPFQLAPADPPRLELAGHLGWEGVGKDEFRSFDDRYDTSLGGASVGYFLTPHIKAEVSWLRGGRGRLYQTELIEMRDRLPIYRSFDHTFEAIHVAPALSYQFLSNRWIHPFVSGGAQITREQHEVFGYETRERTTETAVTASPFVGVGAKFFVSERAFVRTDVRSSIARGDIRGSWTAGFGVEF